MRLQQVIKILLLLIFFDCLSWIVSAQGDCALILDKAQKLYESGSIEEIPQMLAPCIQRGFSDAERLQAYKLIILSYIFNEDIKESNKSMLQFLKKYPEYKLTATDPAEFVQLFNSFHSVPILSIGVSAGGNLSYPGVIKSFVTTPQNLQGRYGNSGIGLQGGINLNLYLATHWELCVEGNYVINYFKYDLNQPDIESINSTEKQNKIEVPVSIACDFGNNKIRPYIRFGGALAYMMQTTSKKSLLISSQNTEITGSEINLQTKRRQINYSGILGGGVKYKIPRGYVFIDIRWNEGIMNQTQTNERYNTEETFKYQNPDNDFRLNYLAFSIGYAHSFFKAKKKK